MEERHWISQTKYWDFFLRQDDAQMLFSCYVDKKLQKELFNKYVMVINLETSSYCNRKCDYCPVGLTTAPKQQVYLKKQLFIKLMNELSEINYKGDFTLALYNEPLADEELAEKISYIREKCPVSRISTNTNGDYLTRAILDELEKAGLDQMFVTCHTLPGEEYIFENKIEEMKRLCERIDVPFNVSEKKFQDNITCEVKYKKLNLYIVSNNWGKIGVYRGGNVEKLSVSDQRKPCVRPFREMTIDHDGYVRMCTNIFTSKNNFGNIENSDILDIYFSKDMTEERSNVFCYGEKDYPHKTCRHPDLYNTYTEKDKENEALRLMILEKGKKH